MSLRARTDALIAAVDIRRTTTIKGDVRALAAALGVPFNGVATTLAAFDRVAVRPPVRPVVIRFTRPRLPTHPRSGASC